MTVKFTLVCKLVLGMSERLKGFRLLIKSKENNLVANKSEYEKGKKRRTAFFFNYCTLTLIKKIRKKKKNKVLLTNQLHPLSSVNYQRNNKKDFKRSV